jgi:hypothetical protein
MLIPISGTCFVESFVRFITDTEYQTGRPRQGLGVAKFVYI